MGKKRGAPWNPQTQDRVARGLDHLRREFSEYQEDRPDVEAEDGEEDE